MKKFSNKHFKLNKINISKLDTSLINNILGGAYETIAGQGTCTSSRSTVDFSGQKTTDGNP